MKRIFGSLVASCILLTGCGGKLQSPDFDSKLQAIQITYTPVLDPATNTNIALTAPGSTYQFNALGLYSTPPGTKIDNSRTVVCPTDSKAACTQGTVSGVTWSIDPASSTTGVVATINASGLATGVRRGTATVRAKVAGIADDTEILKVDGEVLESLTIQTDPNPASVPTGRSISFKAIPTCSQTQGGTPGPCKKTNYNYSWSLPANFSADSVTFSPNPAVGEIIVVKTKRFGNFSLDLKATNEEGTVIPQSVPFAATERVLDDVIISADPVQSTPVPIIIGTKTRFVARGLFSDGAIADIRAGDLKTALTWSQDVAAVGTIVIENMTGTSPNSAVLVSGDQVGTTGLTVKSTNIEPATQNMPNGRELEDRIPVVVKTFGLLGLVDICPFDSVANECMQNVQLPLGTKTKFKVRGKFQDNPNAPRDIDQTKIPLTWSKTVTSTSGDVTVETAGTPPLTTGEYTATKGGVVTLNVALTSTTFEPAASPRTVSTPVTVIEQICKEQLLTSNGTTSTVSSTNVTNAGSVIDSDQATFGTISLTSGLLASDETMSFQRTGVVVTPPASTGQSLGFLMAYDATTFSPDSLATIQTLDAGGAVVQNLTASSSQLTGVPARNGGMDTLVAVKATATMPFTGARLTVSAPDAVSPLPIDIPVVSDLLALLLGGGSTDVHVYAVCSAFNN